MVDISTTIASVKLDSCVFNASGPADVTLAELEKIARSKSSAITMKSCTLEAREGNPEPRYADLIDGSINSMGLPNLGYKAYVEFSQLLNKKYKKPVVASISGMTLEDNIRIFEAFNDSPVDFIEFNPGSPNTIGKPIVGYDMQLMDKLLKAVSKACKKPFGVKLPPYFDVVHFEEVAKVIKKYPVKFVTCINSIGNGLVIDPKTEKPLIKPKGGMGGIGGKYIKYTALANVRRFYELFNGKIDVIGVGGIYSGVDAFEFILAGASAVQIGTAYLQKGPTIFAKVQNELKNIMKKKNYKKLSDFRGKLKTLD
ncbi:MAG: Dihydroorotate dehydrogenase [Candidatus Woesebacteria bacterium GW2011_GWB1_38_5b]|uniref:Dihydroorotate dehydrogenase n=3 Tax=Microgenomates group TaxID=1794810 RepID=A0A1F5G834_9BACT|nr:MAG: Dihydroorotate dehydrogenase [Candidatus Woesebacteria bacterium GW2011_GWB1_38_5b]OGD88016.1 MAG: dihydroorotate oxidase [Candidatus Curtissbacteria bacterium RIFCSPHIGHO2_02_FULL_40_16b]OGD99698.1 MAG: dihydroorotate oxidase [Candidatus Curtissbacteria bacterium RIFCSPLOWO2_02_FULL_40_11]OGE02129.1 MAG: dihydroorotate oxidase [Candidatus Curtissbacteria bacterium RIFCSPLOWO2_01_FULL_39_62]OGE13684.1 MAG: dihydroorotate oxidase [Candidatus Curtissbacteria bacterium RIFCSPLOWO2_12_FULL_